MSTVNGIGLYFFIVHPLRGLLVPWADQKCAVSIATHVFRLKKPGPGTIGKRLYVFLREFFKLKSSREYAQYNVVKDLADLSAMTVSAC
jgi:hypothetical protein